MCMLIVKRIVSIIPMNKSWNGFSFPITTPNEIKTDAAARPPSRTLKNKVLLGCHGIKTRPNVL